jgi:hypothetical protein
MTPEVIAAIAAGIVTVLTAFFGFSKWLVTTFLHELKPNGGSSIKDKIDRLEQRIDDIYQILAGRKE